MHFRRFAAAAHCRRFMPVRFPPAIAAAKASAIRSTTGLRRSNPNDGDAVVLFQSNFDYE